MKTTLYLNNIKIKTLIKGKLIFVLSIFSKKNMDDTRSKKEKMKRLLTSWMFALNDETNINLLITIRERKCKSTKAKIQSEPKNGTDNQIKPPTKLKSQNLQTLAKNLSLNLKGRKKEAFDPL